MQWRGALCCFSPSGIHASTSTSVQTDIDCGCGYYVGSGCCAVSGVWLWALLVSVHTDIECGGGYYECYQCAEVLRRPPVHPQLYSDCGTNILYTIATILRSSTGQDATCEMISCRLTCRLTSTSRRIRSGRAAII